MAQTAPAHGDHSRLRRPACIPLLWPPGRCRASSKSVHESRGPSQLPHSFGRSLESSMPAPPPHLPRGPQCQPWPSEAVPPGVLRMLRKGHLPMCSAGRLGGARHQPPCNRDMQSARVSSCLRLPPRCHGRQHQRGLWPLRPLQRKALSQAGHNPPVQESVGPLSPALL